jgi:hypothetical protein
MAKTILQINYTYNIPRKEFEAPVSPVAHDIAKVPGLRWKVWLINERENEKRKRERGRGTLSFRR